jgi:hypothetical protein
MTDTTPPGRRQDARQDAARPATVPVAEAARRLGVTPDAVRRRLQRGTLAGEKRAGVWQVAGAALPPDTTATGPSPGPRQDATGQGQDAPPALIDHLRAEVDYLRAELHAERERSAAERERADVLMREALGRIEALTAGPVTDPGEDAPQTRHDAPGEAHAADVADDAPALYGWASAWRQRDDRADIG